MVNLKQLLTEGIFDKGILKAVFMAGGPGSGNLTINQHEAYKFVCNPNQVWYQIS